MELQTHIKIPYSQAPISYESQVFLWGSCFSDHMATKFKQAQFRSMANPFGIIFNPLALQQLFERIRDGRSFEPEDLFESQGIWYSYFFHSQLSSPQQQELLTAANKQLAAASTFLKQCSHVVLTLGTAWGYVLKKGAPHKHADSVQVAQSAPTKINDFWVANCHKQPAALFEKKLASAADISAALEGIQKSIQALNPKAHLLFTVSPVRHLKDGMVANNRSKAILIAAVHDFIEVAAGGTQNTQRPPSNKVSYFPAYEIQMDELRDYRFYKEDMLHPSEQAVSYIWERFKDFAMEKACLSTLGEIAQIQRGLDHRPFHEKAKAHLEFRAQLAIKITALQARYPWMFL